MRRVVFDRVEVLFRVMNVVYGFLLRPSDREVDELWR
jgi:hypothetical protein